MSRILIFGNGQIANEYKRMYPDDITIAKGIDVTNKKEIDGIINELKPCSVINTAAKTDIDWCEDNKKETFEINVLGALNIVEICESKNIHCTHYSSGCIQESKNEEDIKDETDIVNPVCYYAHTKVWAEDLLRKLNCLILRPRQIISSNINRRNTLAKMMTYNKFINIQNSISIVDDFLPVTMKMIKNKAIGTYNIANSGTISPYQIGLLLKKFKFIKGAIKEITKEELNKITKAKRIDCILDCTKLEQSLSIKMPHALDSLSNIIKNINKDDIKLILKSIQDETNKKLNK